VSEGRPVGWRIVAMARRGAGGAGHGTCGDCGMNGPVLSCANDCGSLKCSQCALDAMMNSSHECTDVQYTVIHNPATCSGCEECDE
jgi:hypothetical protein